MATKWLKRVAWAGADAAGGGRGGGGLVRAARAAAHRRRGHAGGRRRRSAHRARRARHPSPCVPAVSTTPTSALGVAHAQDRLWQMETHRRIGAGRLAEVFGESALETDRFLRALGVRRAAAAQWQRAGRRVARCAAGLRRRRQRRAAPGPARASAGVRDPGHRARALGSGGQPGLGHHDGLGPGRELDHRAAAPAPGAADARGAHQPVAACLPGRDAAGHGRLRGAVPRPGARRRCVADRLAAAARDRAAVGRGRRRLQQLGRGRVAHHDRAAAAGQRPAPEAQRAGAVVLRAPRGARPEGGRRHAAGSAGGRAGPERAHRLGLHQYRTRRAGPVPRADRPGDASRCTAHPRAGRPSRRRPTSSRSRASPTCR